MKRRFEFNYGFDTFRGDLFGGTWSQISGPTAPMAVAMAVITTSHVQPRGGT